MANKSILVVGGGIAGITAAVEAAEVGYEVFLVEKNAYLGGKVSQINEYFPKLCPPNCGLEINFQRIKKNSNIRVITLAEVENISGQEGNFDVTVKINPRYTTEGCTGCGKCAEVCPVERANDFNFGLDKTKAAYLPQPFAFPMKYVIDSAVCLGASCGKCVEACEVKAVDLAMAAKTMNINVGAVIWATGWDSYDIAKLHNYGSGTVANAISNIMMERLAALTGPTNGKILRPSDGKEPKNIAFVQCAGSRDENHQKACSSVCCMATLKQITYVKKQYPDAKVTIYYMDIRAMGKHEDFYNKVQEYDITMIKGKPSEIKEDAESKDVIVLSENQITQEITELKYDMVVLATGMAPATAAAQIPAAAAYDVDGFVVNSSDAPGIYGAGCVAKPGDVASSVQGATAAVIKAIQSTVRG
ncbi:CoB--CoM heterodisulfide reductase iron-sulfur subunit A family protein [Desulforamulus aquiferis]|uniref:CoB--CoM heterodisulfide reductase iron-sulfur subunit A family protein n=1 Tax=Desulforamulus aquiferis TaxID=1397668 RepID=A0AAW7ZCG7_9FIRM|nr:CoB--CoM heterodisulfide reductase iron-sulfur subunit A family protein [Desulforamulus aquiferis]MDO7787031.1 CoB--CoM heterodisulfide reductase iron-sulfur subunit A family protein [Desulforamulus aquiferis]